MISAQFASRVALQRDKVASFERQLEALARMHALVEEGSQFIVATHSPILMAYPDACIYECRADGIVEKAYEELAHVRVMRAFLANPAASVQALLRGDH